LAETYPREFDAKTTQPTTNLVLYVPQHSWDFLVIIIEVSKSHFYSAQKSKSAAVK